MILLKLIWGLGGSEVLIVPGTLGIPGSPPTQPQVPEVGGGDLGSRCEC